MKLLITGGAGYIGSITAAKLIEAGHEITILDSMEKGHERTLEMLRQVYGNFEFIKVDLRDKARLEHVLEGKSFDAVLHFAAFIEIGRSVKEPELFMDNNFGGTKNLIEVVTELGVNKMVFSSTAAVYGNPDTTPIKETHEIKPINPYGESKVKSEELLQKYAEEHSLDSIRLRYFNPAGSYKGNLGELHTPETHLIPLIFRAAKGEIDELQIYGDDYETHDGTPIRDYIHIEDLVDAHLDALEYLKTYKGSDVFNVGTGKGYTVKEVFETAKTVTGFDIPYRIVDRREGDAAELVADPTKINAVMNWKAQYNLYDIIKSAWDFARGR